MSVLLYEVSSVLFLCDIPISFTWTHLHVLRSAGTWREGIWGEADPLFSSLLPSPTKYSEKLNLSQFLFFLKKDTINFKSQRSICNITIKTFMHCIELFVMYIVSIFILYCYYFTLSFIISKDNLSKNQVSSIGDISNWIYLLQFHSLCIVSRVPYLKFRSS